MEKLNNASRAKAFPEPLHAVRSSSDHPLHTPQRPPLPTPHRPAAQPLQATSSTPLNHSSFRTSNDMRALSAAPGAGGGTGPAPPPRSSRPPPTPGVPRLGSSGSVPHGDRAAAVPTSSLRGNDCSSARSNRLAKDLPLVGAGDADAIALAAEVASANRFVVCACDLCSAYCSVNSTKSLPRFPMRLQRYKSSRHQIHRP